MKGLLRALRPVESTLISFENGVELTERDTTLTAFSRRKCFFSPLRFDNKNRSRSFLAVADELEDKPLVQDECSMEVIEKGLGETSSSSMDAIDCVPNPFQLLRVQPRLFPPRFHRGPPNCVQVVDVLYARTDLYLYHVFAQDTLESCFGSRLVGQKHPTLIQTIQST